MSFFDDDEPTRATSGTRRRPGRPATPRTPAAPAGSGGPPVDHQTVRTRQAIALAIGVLLLVLIVFGVNSCMNSRKERSLKNYNRDVAAIIADSDDQVAKPFFDLLSSGDATGNDLQVQVNQVRFTAEEDAKRANDLNVPDEMVPAQRNLMLTLNLRSEALNKIAELLPKAQGRGQQAETATTGIAGQMQSFLASDVVYSQRTAPLIKQALDEAGISGQEIRASRSLPGYKWLAPDTIAASIGGTSSGGSSGGNTTATPGTHGHGLTSVAIGDTTLDPDTTNTVTAGASPTVNVTFQNQGENDESNVIVAVKLTAQGSKTISVEKTIKQTKAGEETTVAIPLGATVPKGKASRLTVNVQPVAGEQTTDNNRGTYTVLFTG